MQLSFVVLYKLAIKRGNEVGVLSLLDALDVHICILWILSNMNWIAAPVSERHFASPTLLYRTAI